MEHRTAASEYYLNFIVCIPAGNLSLKLGRSGVVAAVLEADFYFYAGNAFFSRSRDSALYVAVTETVAGRVGAAAAEGGAEFGVTVHNCRIACHIAGFFFFVRDCRHVAETEVPTVDKDKFNVGVFGSDRFHCVGLKETGSNDDFRAVCDSLVHSLDTVVVGCVGAVSGLIILIGFLVCFRISFGTFVSTLVETAVHQLTYVGNDCDFIGLFLAGRQTSNAGNDHNDCYDDSQEFFHFHRYTSIF